VSVRGVCAARGAVWRVGGREGEEAERRRGLEARQRAAVAAAAVLKRSAHLAGSAPRAGAGPVCVHGRVAVAVWLRRGCCRASAVLSPRAWLFSFFVPPEGAWRARGASACRCVRRGAPEAVHTLRRPSSFHFSVFSRFSAFLCSVFCFLFFVLYSFPRLPTSSLAVRTELPPAPHAAHTMCGAALCAAAAPVIHHFLLSFKRMIP